MLDAFSFTLIAVGAHRFFIFLAAKFIEFPTFVYAVGLLLFCDANKNLIIFLERESPGSVSCLCFSKSHAHEKAAAVGR
jgi:hypothetical protein